MSRRSISLAGESGRAAGGGGRRGGGSGAGASDEPVADPRMLKRMAVVESDYRRFILFVQEGDEQSSLAVDMLKRNIFMHAATYIQDARALEPAVLERCRGWLKGTPLLIDQESRDPETGRAIAKLGTDCLDFIENFIAPTMGVTSKRIMGKRRRVGFRSAHQTTGNFAQMADAWKLPPDVEAALRRLPKHRATSEGRFTEADLSKYMAQRKMFDANFQQAHRGSKEGVSTRGSTDPHLLTLEDEDDE